MLKFIVNIFLLLIFILNLSAQEIVKEYFITCSSDDFDYIYAYPNYLENIYIPITLTYNGKTWTDVHMRIRGDDSRNLPKKSLKIKFDSERFIDGRDVLNFNAEYLDKSYIHQYISSRLMRESGQVCFEAEHARLYINGKFRGLYLRIENVDEDFLNIRGLDTKGNLFKASKDGACLSIYDDDFVWEKKTNKNSGKADLFHFIEQINSVPDNEYYNFAHEYLDYEKMVNIIAMNMLLANGSTYYHNYYMYHDKNYTGKWIMFPWDMDKTLSHYGKNYSYNRSSGGWVPDNPFLERALISDTIFSDIRKKVDELTESIFNEVYLFPIIDSLKRILSNSVFEDQADNIPDTAFWITQIESEKEFIKKRYLNLQYQFNNWPKTFKVERRLDIYTDNVLLKWHPSMDPNGGSITYSLYYSTDYDLDFPENYVNVISGISDTCYLLTEITKEDKYYWKIVAKDKDGYGTEGFDTKNYFYYKHATVLPCEINNDMVLKKKNSPYLIDCDFVVRSGASLIIEEGVELIMANSTSILIYGEMHVIGTNEYPVRIRPDFEVNLPGKISINYPTGNCSFLYASIEDVSLETFSAFLFIDKVNFINSKVLVNPMINIKGGNVTFRNSTIISNDTGEGLLVWDSDVIVENSYFFDVPDAIELLRVKDGIIRGNRVENSPDDAIDLNACTNVLISGNTIFNNKDKGISIGNDGFGMGSDNITIEKNLIVGNDIGIAIKSNSSAYINQNTLVRNNISISCYEKEEGFGGAKAIVENTIIANSITYPFKVDLLSEISIKYSLCNTELIEGEGNLKSDPNFISVSDFNFRLRTSSPCINAGNPASPLDPDGTRTDIGAFYYSFYPPQIIINEINYNSDVDFNSGDWLEFYNPENFPVDISYWIIKDEQDDNEYVFPEGTIIQPLSFLVLCNSMLLFSELYPDVYNYIGNFDFGLSSDGELIRLYDLYGHLVDSVHYGTSYPWAIGPNGNGSTLELKEVNLDNSLAENWAASENHGTPGGINSVSEFYENLEYGKLLQNFPNPFNSKTTINYQVLSSGYVDLSVYNIYGQLISKLVDKYQVSGNYTATWNASNNNPGIYLYRLLINNKTCQTKRAIYFK